VPTDKKNISGFVLTGGKSSRMGSDKGLMPFDRKPLVLHALETLDEVAEQVMISANDAVYSQFSLPVVPDVVHDIGPMGGIYSCLRQSATEFNIFLPCDTPFVPPDLFILLLQHIGDHPCAVPVHDDNKMEPLCAVYRKSCLETFAEFIEKGCYKVHDALARLGYAAVKIDETTPFYDNLMFFNLNTLPDYHYALHYIENRKKRES
jgi:molybdopterin-guanine dinucleotide biosynthesis protein A